MLVGSSVMFALMATSTAGLSGRVPAVELVAIRCVFGLVVLTLYFVARRRGPDLSNVPQLAMRGLFGTLAVFSYFYAIEQLGAGPATVLNFISPCYAAIFAPYFLNERSSKTVLWGLAVSTVGASLVAWGSSTQGAAGPSFGLGVVAGLMSGLAGGASTTTNRALRSGATDAATIFFAFCFVGAVITVPFAAHRYVAITGNDWWLVLVMAATSVGGQLLYSHALGFTQAVLAGVVNQLVPVFTFGLAVAFLSQVPRGLTLLGAGLCIAGVLVGVWPGPKAISVISPPT